MFPALVPLLLSSIKDMIIDKAQNLAEDHVEQAIERNIPPEAREMLETAIKEDPNHSATNLKDFLKL